MHRTQLRLAYFTLALVVFFYLVSLTSLFLIRPDFVEPVENLPALVWQLLQDSFSQFFLNTAWQALVSTGVILLTAYCLAKSLPYLGHKTRLWTLTITNATFSLPTILVVYAVLSIFGQAGWLSKLWGLFGVKYDLSIYGLVGLVLANSYFNIGYAGTALANALDKIPQSLISLSQQNRFSWWQTWRYLEYPYLKATIANLGLMMFMLCFNNFAMLLFLGGGPKYANFEVGIYQALLNEFDFVKASVLAGFQLVFSLVLIFLLSRSQAELRNQDLKNRQYHQWAQVPKQIKSKQAKSKQPPQQLSRKKFAADDSKSANTSTKELARDQTYQRRQTKDQALAPKVLPRPYPYSLPMRRLFARFYCWSCIGFALLPMLAVAGAGLVSLGLIWRQQTHPQSDSLDIVARTFSYDWGDLGYALTISGFIALGSALLALMLAVLVLRGIRWLGARAQVLIANLSLLGFAVPSMLVGAGYYLLFSGFEVGLAGLLTLLILAGATSALAYVLHYLFPAYRQVHQFARLAQNLNLGSWQAFKTYEWTLLKPSLGYALINLFILSLGDFSLILFFVSEELTSVTYLLSAQLSSLSGQHRGNVTAFVLLAFVLGARLLTYSWMQKTPKTMPSDN